MRGIIRILGHEPDVGELARERLDGLVHALALAAPEGKPQCGEVASTVRKVLVDRGCALVAGERSQRPAARERLVHDEVEGALLVAQPRPAVVAGKLEAPRTRVLALEPREPERLSGDVDDLLVNLHDAHGDGRQVHHEPLGKREAASPDDGRAREPGQLAHDACLLALVLARKLAPQLVGGVGHALERPVDVEHAHGRPVVIGGVKQQREAKLRSPHRDAAPGEDAHAQ